MATTTTTATTMSLSKAMARMRHRKIGAFFHSVFFDFGCCVAETKDDMQGVSDMMRQREGGGEDLQRCQPASVARDKHVFEVH